MGKLIDLTGQYINGIKVLERDYSVADKKRAYWKCQCKCGNVFTTRGDSLRSGHTTSCGHCPTKNQLQKIENEKKHNLVGQIFGRLTVIAKDEEKTGYWICECECGNIVSRRKDSLKSQGEKASCGCRKKELTSLQWSAQLEGQSFGKLKVIERVPHNELRNLWKCKCECGNIVFFPSRYLLSMNVKSCGCESRSYGELEIRKQLQALHITFKEQYTFKDCLTENNRPIRYDFAIFDKNNNVICLIEYNGQQHYSAIDYFGGEDKFKQQQLRDNLKRNYCLSHKIPLIEIPYTELYNLNIQQQLQKKGVIV